MHGIYIAYFTGSVGNSIGIFYVADGQLVGADIGGVKYDGKFSIADDGLHGTIEFTIPAGGTLITGHSGGSEPTRVEFPITLPPDFTSGSTISLQTPTGPVNARFEKIRDLPSR